MSSYLGWLRTVLEPTIETLRDDGSLFVHCDWRASHHIRVLLDELMGAGNFRNEIIWNYRRWTGARTNLQRLHQTIFYYAKSSSHQPVIPLVEYSPTTNIEQIWQARTRDERNVTVYDEVDGQPRNNGSKKGVPLGDVWEIPYLNPKAKERVGYPTQKPLVLLERIIELASEPGDLVLDPCCGSGTTVIAAHLLERNAIGIDKSLNAIQIANHRLEDPIRSPSRLLSDGESFDQEATPAHQGALDLLGAHRVRRHSQLHGYLSPSGLATLGLDTEWSVPVAFIDETAGDVTEMIRALDALAGQKSADALLALGENRLPPSRGRIVCSIRPSNLTEVQEVRRDVGAWLREQEQREST